MVFCFVFGILLYYIGCILLALAKPINALILKIKNSLSDRTQEHKPENKINYYTV